MSNWATIVTTKPKEIEVLPEKIEVEKIEVENPKEYKPKKSFNIFFRSGILRTEFKKYTSFEEWEYQYFYHLSKLYDILACHLSKQDFTLNCRKASLQRKFNQMIFQKSSKYTLQNFELSENDQKQYDHYIKCLPVN